MELEFLLLTTITIMAMGVGIVCVPVFVVNLVLLVNYRKSDGRRIGVNLAWLMILSGIKNRGHWPERVLKRVGYTRRMLIYSVLGVVISVTAGNYQQQRLDQVPTELNQQSSAQ
ncbi:hypothetical protein BTA51_13630 [Hahella sp. CCB-MM4]|uniref:hypothetical protein n=1 Tax=Hahella sp. (strain CCB-MM4) TaxID=1926491 RepID=UPI000B9AD2B7|nr:hypothetical protein [Hahella sp. CCB-MM4]OZG72990.1 hypothetical protein BTA51_13630 [Hahella sp. CCB-MM4]